MDITNLPRIVAIPPLPPAKKQSLVTDSLAARIRDEAKAQKLQRISKSLMTNDELQELWVLLEKSGTNEHINYDEYREIIPTFGNPKVARYLTPNVFAALSSKTTVVNIVSLFNYIARKTWFERTKIELSLHDVTAEGYLTESELENYIQELIPGLKLIDPMNQSILDPSCHPFWNCVVVRKFMFFLDPFRSGKIKINDILESGFLEDLLELKDAKSSETESDDEVLNDTNWFSVSNYRRLYDHYVDMDTDENGMLNVEELKSFGGETRTFTNAFIERFFEEAITYDDEIDFKSFIDLMLALENKKQVQSLHFFFKIFDVNKKGFLNSFDFYYFYKSIREHLLPTASSIIDFNDMRNEILDIIKPPNSERITFNDLVSCGQGHTVVSLIIEYTGYIDYEANDNPGDKLDTGENMEGAIDDEIKV